MSFTVFVAWVLVGVLAGVLAGLVMRGGQGLKADVILGLAGSIGLSGILRGFGIVSSTWIVAVVFVALVGATLSIVAQRKLRPTDYDGDMSIGMWRWGLGAGIVVIVIGMNLIPSPPPPATAAGTEDKTYTVTPAAMKVKMGIVTGEMTDMKVTERIEQGSTRIVSPARFTARVTLKNSSPNQTVRLAAGRMLYLDAQGQPIKLEDSRTEPTFKLSGGERLDPGQEITESVEVDFPANALAAKKLKDIRLEIAYVPSPYREETAQFGVAIGTQP